VDERDVDTVKRAPFLGLTLTARGGGYTPVCLVCSMRLAVITRTRSDALVMLDLHSRQAHT
jgi:hypothetical protein